MEESTPPMQEDVWFNGQGDLRKGRAPTLSSPSRIAALRIPHVTGELVGATMGSQRTRYTEQLIRDTHTRVLQDMYILGKKKLV